MLIPPLSASELPSDVHQALLELLFKTYPLYVDRPSRQAVQQCLRSILRAPAPIENVKYLTQKLQTETSKPGLAPASAFVLLEWCSILLQHLRDDSTTPLSVVLDIIAVDAKALETCLAGSPRPAVKVSSLRVTRRALRAVFSSETWGDDAIRQSVGRLTSDSAGQRNAPFLGVISGVCARLEAKKPVLQELKKTIFAFYVKDIVGSRTVVPTHIANGLFDFFFSFATYDDVVSELVPPLEKAILRAPEVVLSGVISALCASLSEEIDLSEVLHSRLLKHLLASMKSNNAVIRQGAAQSFESLLSKCRTESWLVKVATEVIGPLKTQKITNADQRAVYAQILVATPSFVDLSKEVVQGFVPVFARESNEVALEQEIKAFCKHLAFVIQSTVKVSDDVVNAIVKGSSEKRVPFRKLWQLNVGEILWNTDSKALATTEVQPLVSKFINKMKDLFKEVASNPLPSAQNGILSAAYVFVALFERFSKLQGQDVSAWEDTVAESMLLNPKPSFLLNPRAYSKLASQAEVQWVVRALAAVASGSKFESAEDAAKNAWAQAFIYAITGPGLPTNFREKAARALSNVYLKNSAMIGRIVIGGLWSWILSLRTAEKESAALSAGLESAKYLHLVVKAICPSVSDVQGADLSVSDLTVKSQLLVELLLLCRPELISNVSWIALCLRTGTDPGNLVRELPDECLKQLTRVNEVCYIGPAAVINHVLIVLLGPRAVKDPSGGHCSLERRGRLGICGS